MPGAYPSYGANSFIFTYIFTKKAPVSEFAPLTAQRPRLEILDLPLIKNIKLEGIPIT